MKCFDKQRNKYKVFTNYDGSFFCINKRIDSYNFPTSIDCKCDECKKKREDSDKKMEQLFRKLL